MAVTIRYSPGKTGKNYVVTAQRLDNSEYWDEITDQAWEAAPSFADKSLVLVEGTSEDLGSYSASFSGNMGSPGDVWFRVHDDDDANNKVVASQIFDVQSNAIVTLDAAEVNTQVVDVIRTDTISELGSVPAATPTLSQAVMMLYMWLRNNSESNTTLSVRRLRNDAGTVIGAGTFSDDGSVYQQGKMS